MRRPPQFGQTARALHEKGTSRSNAQASHRTRVKPWTSSPQRRKLRNSRSTKAGKADAVGARRGVREKFFQVIADDPVEDGGVGGPWGVGTHGAGKSACRAAPPRATRRSRASNCACNFG